MEMQKKQERMREIMKEKYCNKQHPKTSTTKYNENINKEFIHLTTILQTIKLFSYLQNTKHIITTISEIALKIISADMFNNDE